MTQHSNHMTCTMPYQCDLCGMTFSDEHHIAVHMISHVAVKIEPYYSIESQNDTHCSTNIHNGRISQAEEHATCKIQPITCIKCDRTFTTTSNRTKHMIIHTGKKPFSCNVCRKSFPRKDNLTRHIKGHSRKYPFTCELCSKSYSKKCELTKHLRMPIHSKVSCSECNQILSSSCKLSKHMILHAKKIPFACKVCKRIFNDRYGLKRHMRVHSGDKPFTCEVCERSFSLKANLSTHMRIHTGKKILSCEVCGASFAQFVNILRHMQSHKGKSEGKTQIHVPSNSVQKQEVKDEKPGEKTSHQRVHSCPMCRKGGFARYFDESQLKKHMENHIEKQKENSRVRRSWVHRSATRKNGHRRFEVGKRGRDRNAVHRSTTQKNGPRRFEVGKQSRDMNVVHRSTTQKNGHQRFEVGKRSRDRNRHTCITCGHSFVDRDRLQWHMLSHEKKRPVLKVCRVSLTKCDHLVKDTVLHGESIRHTCAICDEEFSDEESLDVHKGIHTWENTPLIF